MPDVSKWTHKFCCRAQSEKQHNSDWKFACCLTDFPDEKSSFCESHEMVQILHLNVAVLSIVHSTCEL